MMLNKRLELETPKKLHTYLKDVYGPRSATISPLKSADGSTLIKDPKGILNRWKEHFDQLLNRPSIVNHTFIDQIEQREKNGSSMNYELLMRL